MIDLKLFLIALAANVAGQFLGGLLIIYALRGYWQATARWQQAQDDERT